MSEELENHVFDRSEYVILSTNGPRLMLGEMKDIDQIAMAFAKEWCAPDDYITIGTMSASIKSALAAYGDECAKQMREDALCAYNTYWNCEPIKINDAIRALPLSSERGK